MNRLAVAIGAALTLAWTSVSFAQTDVCIVPRTNAIDQNATAAWRQMAAQADPRVMQALAGTWYTESRSPATNQVSYLYNTFEPNGLYSYQNRVCGGMTGMCNDYQGHGLFAARGLGVNQITMMLIVSDLNRDRQCTGSSGRFIDNNTMQDGAGGMWRRVR